MSIVLCEVRALPVYTEETIHVNVVMGPDEGQRCYCYYARDQSDFIIYAWIASTKIGIITWLSFSLCCATAADSFASTVCSLFSDEDVLVLPKFVPAPPPYSAAVASLPIQQMAPPPAYAEHAPIGHELHPVLLEPPLPGAIEIVTQPKWLYHILSVLLAL